MLEKGKARDGLHTLVDPENLWVMNRKKKDPSDWKFESLNALEPTASYRISVFSDLLWVSAMAVWATGQIVNQNEQGLFMPLLFIDYIKHFKRLQ